MPAMPVRDCPMKNFVPEKSLYVTVNLIHKL